ncbi:hypothetical protein PCANC_08134 [Puccinia coronata f. sp. avenae]|jgi:hypothetical protein|uniref:Uncharacterized protein n=1 Tax=Puccinia coronata f. sp. avenae TaxID=200324 RepID=A0A2N5VM24_9BASI|nr:hypothetical protein PCANC_08134 [Puccinia coronata f. sp. avenae]
MNKPANLQSLRQFILECTESLDQVLLALAFHIFPLNVAASRSTLQRDFKVCFLPLQQQFCVAATNLRDAANSCLGAVEESEGNEVDDSKSDEVNSSKSDEVDSSESNEVNNSESNEVKDSKSDEVKDSKGD